MGYWSRTQANGVMMKHSIVICYRDRLEHLKITVPRIKEVLKDKEHEIIVIEQDDDKKFRRANTLNEGAKLATGDIIILHDVDYYPVNVLYHDEVHDVYLPVRRVEFTQNDLTARPEEEIPSGYRHFKTSVDDDFFGGVISFKKEAFFRCGGFSPLFIGWGFEDADLRQRIAINHLTVKRANDSLFYALAHSDSGPSANDPDFRNNMRLFSNWKNYTMFGARSQLCHKEEITPLVEGVDKWVKVREFDIITDLYRNK